MEIKVLHKYRASDDGDYYFEHSNSIIVNGECLFVMNEMNSTHENSKDVIDLMRIAYAAGVNKDDFRVFTEIENGTG